MAVIFTKTVKSTHYEVRTAGSSIRLYTNGVFHSQWNRNCPLGGNLWDLLILPLFFLERPESLSAPGSVFNELCFDVAVLGVGGGAVINQLIALAPNCSVVGIDLDKTHLQLAKRFFGLASSKCVVLKQGNALDWVNQAVRKRERYRLVVEDLFCESETMPGEPVRAVACGAEWLSCLFDITQDDGLLVINFESEQQLRSARKIAFDHLWAREVYCLQKPGYYNAIGVFCKTPIASGVNKQKLLSQLNLLRLFNATNKAKVSNFTIKRVKP
ncbi:hypothetical protein P886_3546 [Alteromonadaceae bacterium 2753L.S.0a.02]|nr:hypothetical protein P886_3546 [Alteromonadaceae bacterium 2753L.S.0a.02]